MAGFFTKNNANLSPRAIAQEKYNAGRLNLLVMLIFTLGNSILALTGSDTYLLFSATIPYFCTHLGMYFSGKLPAEYYVDVDMENLALVGSFLVVVMAVIAVVAMILYAVCYLASSKNRFGWLIAAAVLFALDTVAMLAIYGVSADMILDGVFHVWVLCYLIIGISNGIKLKRMPAEEPLPAVPAAEAPAPAAEAVAGEAMAGEAVAAESAPEAPAAEETDSAQN